MHLEGNPRRRSISGHIYVTNRDKGSVWYWRIRLPEGFTHPDGSPRPRSAGRSDPPGPVVDALLTATSPNAQRKQALEARLTDLRRGVGIPTPGTGASFRDAAEHWYIHRGQQQEWKPSRRDYRSALDISPAPHVRRTPPGGHHRARHRVVADGKTRRRRVQAVDRVEADDNDELDL